MSWRTSKAKPRIIVGKLTIDQLKNVDFEYINLPQIRQNEFKGYPGLNMEVSKHNNVLDLFSKRLINTSRSDSQDLLDFWEIESGFKNDKLYMLAMTQGLTSIDNFEFLADFNLRKGMHFVTDIAALSHSKYNLAKIKKGDLLTFEKEDHPKDGNAVKVMMNNEHVGYVKQIHNRVFHQEGADEIKIEVKRVIDSPDERKLFVKVFV